MERRQLRSASSKATPALSSVSAPTSEPIKFVPGTSSHAPCRIQAPGSQLEGLSSAEANLLRRKQRKLKSEAVASQASLPPSEHFQRSLASTLIFAQEAAGTAVCISPSGLVLTCAHCIAEDEEGFKTFESTWLLFYTGQSIQVKCLAWDPIRDLALLQIVTVEASVLDEGLVPKFSSVPIGHSSPRVNLNIYCIGQPGRDDLESSVARKTKYNLVEISHGRFRGNVKDADPQDNSDIGTLKHDAWTYWGHSGAPLLRLDSGELCGLHSSWDDQTAMRHGVPLIAIREFLHLFVDSRSHPVGKDLEELIGPINLD